jgi:hypothetical protein
MLSRFEDIQILERLDETHGGTTQIVIGKHEERLVVCKVVTLLCSLSARRPSGTARV